MGGLAATAGREGGNAVRLNGRPNGRIVPTNITAGDIAKRQRLMYTMLVVAGRLIAPMKTARHLYTPAQRGVHGASDKTADYVTTV